MQLDPCVGIVVLKQGQRSIPLDRQQPRACAVATDEPLTGQQQWLVNDVGAGQAQLGVLRLLCCYRADQVDSTLAQGRESRVVGLEQAQAYFQAQLLGQHTGVLGADAFVGLAGAEHVEGRVVAADYPQVQMALLPQPAQVGGGQRQRRPRFHAPGVELRCGQNG